ncbi:unnamed protein product [Nesidiocoris tenuis]|uniref:Uncharacterized protein n=1 Tax=Nesidiocoris tenuis TaxID=355587 RepID=A0A6H5GI61_9HEMI|nr:unnamed protein product [Nesidiocoris tenuis]
MPDALRQRTKYGLYSLFKTSWKYQTREFFENSTLHGVRYVAEKGRPIYEKLIWFSFVSMGAIVTLIVILALWEKFQTNPTITGLDTDFHNWNVPFPGITLCLTTPFSEKRFLDHVNRSENIKSNFVNSVNCDHLCHWSKNTLHHVQHFYLKAKTACFVPQLAFRCEDFMGNCTFKQEEIPCCEAFRPTFTDHGLCFSFNTIHAEVDWSWKPPGLNATMEKLHQVYETDSTWSVKFDADLDKIHENARQLSIKQRKCVFKDEKELLSAKEYSYWACMNDCRMKLAKERCFCVPFIVVAVHEIKNASRCSCELGCDNTRYEVVKLSDR